MKSSITFFFVLLISFKAIGQNPIVTDMFTADPAAMVHNDTVYLYTGHDEASENGTFYVMNNWQCFTSTDMVTWKNHGAVFHVADVSWASGDAWAGEVEERNGNYYFYFCAEHKTIKGKAVGVAIADNPYGPFKDIGKPLISNDMTSPSHSWDDIDPTVMIDNDGQAYMYWGNTICYYVKLKENMTQIEGDIVNVTESLPSFTEAPYLHKENGVYYLSYAYGWAEKIAYATSESITGPWTFRSVINEYVNNCGTNHQSIINFKGQTYFIYHTGDIGGDYQRSVAIEYLYYNDDNTIKEIVQTPYGIAHADITAKCAPVSVSAEIIYKKELLHENAIALAEGDSVTLVALSDQEGTWTWEGPDGFTAKDDTIVLNDLSAAMSGDYFGIFTNTCGTKSYANIDVTVTEDIGIESGEAYIIKSINSEGKVLSVKDGGTKDGASLRLQEDKHAEYQRFILTYTNDKQWGILPAHATSQAFDVPSCANTDGLKIHTWTWLKNDCQKWNLTLVEAGIYTIQSKASGKCLEINSGTNYLEQNTCDNSIKQQFNIYK